MTDNLAPSPRPRPNPPGRTPADLAASGTCPRAHPSPRDGSTHAPGCGCGEPDEIERRHLAGGFGRRLRELREARGLTQREVAERARISPEHLSRLETGHRRPEARTVHLLVAVLVADSAARASERQQLNRLANRSWRQWRRKNGRNWVESVIEETAQLEAKVARQTQQLDRLRARRGLPPVVRPEDTPNFPGQSQ
jgi:transcriptional regulator with XRE-family HTH domain